MVSYMVDRTEAELLKKKGDGGVFGTCQLTLLDSDCALALHLFANCLLVGLALVAKVVSLRLCGGDGVVVAEVMSVRPHIVGAGRAGAAATRIITLGCIFDNDEKVETFKTPERERVK